MFILRSLNSFSKYITRNRPSIYGATSIRELRRLPRQTSEFKVLTPATNQMQENGREPVATESPPTGSIPSELNSFQLKRNELHLPSTELLEGDLMPTFNLAAYVDKSSSLQQLIQLGVDLSRIERRKGFAQFVLKLNFEQNVKPYLVFLKDHGVSAEQFGEIITKNPIIFKVDLDDLQTRINFLKEKKFVNSQIQRIVTLNPFWLMFSTHRIDNRLGHFQKQFHLSGDDVRFLAAKQPRLITFNMEHIRKSTFCISEEMGFKDEELKCLLLSKPRLWMMQSDELIERFSYAHQEMQLSHDMLIQFPEVLTSRLFRLRQRHEFLKMLGRAQYDPQKDLYISPKAVVEGSDYYFAKNIAKSDMQTYAMFMKTR